MYEGGEEINKLENHHSISIGCEHWKSNVNIANKKEWFGWFVDRGILEPIEEYVEDTESQMQRKGRKRQSIIEFLEEQRVDEAITLYRDLFSIHTLLLGILG